MLTGGGSTRLGQDKATVVRGPTDDRPGAGPDPADVPVVVVYPDPGVQRSVQVTRKIPGAVGGGVGRRTRPHRRRGVIAADMPWAVQWSRDSPRAGPKDARAATGRVAPSGSLAAAYRHDRPARRGTGGRHLMRALLDRLQVRAVLMPESAFADIDTPALVAAEERLAIMESDEERFDMQAGWMR